MSLKAKSEENIIFVEKCVKNNRNLNIGACRAYYAVFQKIKYYLINDGFNYDAFLKKIGAPKREKKFSHGTISKALVDSALNKGKSIRGIAPVVTIGNLYSKRKDADYENTMITFDKLDESYREAQSMIIFIDSL